MHVEFSVIDWQTEDDASYDEETMKDYFISCIFCCLSSHCWAGTAFMHTTFIKPAKLAFLQDKGFWEF